MIKRDWDVLFSEYDLRAVLEQQGNRLNQEVQEIGAERFDELTDEFLAASAASELVVPPLRLDEDKITVSSREVKVDVSGDPNRHFSRPGPHYVDGIEVTYHVPFEGERELLKCRPNTFNPNPPRAVIGNEELRFPYDQGNRDVAATKERFDRDLGNLKQWLPWVNQQVVEFNESLEPRARQLVSKRRVDLAKTKSGLESLGYPVRSEATVEASVDVVVPDAKERRAAKRKEAGRQYDVALSFAGEDRGYVEQVADILKDIEVSVFYDRYETVELWGKDLVEHLARVYSEESHFVVMFASRHYADKAWPNHERQHALSRALTGDVGRILPVRLDETKIPGLAPTVGYLDARVLTPKKLAELIRQKLDLEGL